MAAETVAVPHIQVRFIYRDESLDVHCVSIPRIGEHVNHPSGSTLVVEDILHTISGGKGRCYAQIEVVLRDKP